MIERNNKAKQLEYQFFISICSFGAIITIFLFFFDLFYTRNYYSVGIESLAFLLIIFVYLMAKKWKEIRWLNKLLVPSLYAMVNFAIFIDGGGFYFVNAIIFFLVFIVSLIIVDRSERPILIGITWINLTVLLVVDLFYPDLWIIRSPGESEPSYAYLFKILLFLVGGYLVLFLKSRYEILSEKLLKTNEEITRNNLYLEQKVEERTEELRKLNRDLDLLFYRSSHDFRRPLTTLKGLNEVARLTRIDPKGMELMDLMVITVNKMDHMLRKFYMLYEISSYTMDGPKISLKYVIDNLCDRIVREGHRINFKVHLVHYHDLDARNKIIAVILENLAENAIHYAKDGLADITVKLAENNRELNIRFEDRGVGIEETFFNRIFDMYFRGSELSKGNGLGLYVVKTGVEKLKGKIHLESKRNDFTRFEISFPIEQL